MITTRVINHSDFAESDLNDGLYIFFGENMLTSEQTTIRLRDAEISRLRKENERLTERVKQMKMGFVEIMRFVAKDMNYFHKSKMMEMANELEQDV